MLAWTGALAIAATLGAPWAIRRLKSRRENGPPVGWNAGMRPFSLKKLLLAVALVGSGAGMAAIFIKRFGQTDQLMTFVSAPFLGAIVGGLIGAGFGHVSKMHPLAGVLAGSMAGLFIALTAMGIAIASR